MWAARVAALAAGWRASEAPPADTRGLFALHRATVLNVLQDEWAQGSALTRDELIAEIDRHATAAADAAAAAPHLGETVKRMRYLAKVARDPWYHPTLKKVLADTIPPPHEVEAWLQEEGCSGALERLRLLSAAGASGEKAARRLALALAPTPPARSVLPSHFYYRALDSLLVLLQRAGRTSDCIAHIKAMDAKYGAPLVARLASKTKSDGRIWKSARETALLCTHVLMATSLVRPLEEGQLGALAKHMTSLYGSRAEELAPAVRKLLHSADTASHIYVVCRAMQRELGPEMRPFVCELYVRALTTGMNELERLKLQNEEQANDLSHKLAQWFLSLSEFFSSDPPVAAECALTAFSLHPSKAYLSRIEAIAGRVREARSRRPPEGSAPASERPEAQAAESKTESGSLISSAVLEGEDLELSSDLRHDLVVLLNGPRLKMLTWDLEWEELSAVCVSYMTDTEEGTKTLTTELKYVHLDYSQFDIKEPEVHDVYFGIEKGYEHHLELDDDDDEEEEWNETPAVRYKEYVSVDSGDDYEKTHKKPKKSSKKPQPRTDAGDEDSAKCSSVKKEKKANKGEFKNKCIDELPPFGPGRSWVKPRLTMSRCPRPDSVLKVKLNRPSPQRTENLKPLASPFRRQTDMYYASIDELLKNNRRQDDNRLRSGSILDLSLDISTGIKTLDNFEHYIDSSRDSSSQQTSVNVKSHPPNGVDSEANNTSTSQISNNILENKSQFVAHRNPSAGHKKTKYSKTTASKIYTRATVPSLSRITAYRGLACDNQIPTSFPSSNATYTRNAQFVQDSVTKFNVVSAQNSETDGSLSTLVDLNRPNEEQKRLQSSKGPLNYRMPFDSSSNNQHAYHANRSIEPISNYRQRCETIVSEPVSHSQKHDMCHSTLGRSVDSYNTDDLSSSRNIKYSSEDLAMHSAVPGQHHRVYGHRQNHNLTAISDAPTDALSKDGFTNSSVYNLANEINFRTVLQSNIGIQNSEPTSSSNSYNRNSKFFELDQQSSEDLCTVPPLKNNYCANPSSSLPEKGNETGPGYDLNYQTDLKSLLFGPKTNETGMRLAQSRSPTKGSIQGLTKSLTDTPNEPIVREKSSDENSTMTPSTETENPSRRAPISKTTFDFNIPESRTFDDCESILDDLYAAVSAEIHPATDEESQKEIMDMSDENKYDGMINDELKNSMYATFIKELQSTICEDAVTDGVLQNDPTEITDQNIVENNFLSDIVKLDPVIEKVFPQVNDQVSETNTDECEIMNVSSENSIPMYIPTADLAQTDNVCADQTFELGPEEVKTSSNDLKQPQNLLNNDSHSMDFSRTNIVESANRSITEVLPDREDQSTDSGSQDTDETLSSPLMPSNADCLKIDQKDIEKKSPNVDNIKSNIELNTSSDLDSNCRDHLGEDSVLNSLTDDSNVIQINADAALKSIENNAHAPADNKDDSHDILIDESDENANKTNSDMTASVNATDESFVEVEIPPIRLNNSTKTEEDHLVVPEITIHITSDNKITVKSSPEGTKSHLDSDDEDIEILRGPAPFSSGVSLNKLLTHQREKFAQKCNINCQRVIKQNETKMQAANKYFRNLFRKMAKRRASLGKGSGSNNNRSNPLQITAPDEVVDLISDSDNSDVEIIVAEDPIAIEPKPKSSDAVEYPIMIKSKPTGAETSEDPISAKNVPIKSVNKSTTCEKLSKLPMLTFIEVPKFKQKRRGRPWKRPGNNPKSRQESQDENMHFYCNASCRILKVSKLAPEDKAKLQMACCVKVERYNPASSQNTTKNEKPESFPNHQRNAEKQPDTSNKIMKQKHFTPAILAKSKIQLKNNSSVNLLSIKRQLRSRSSLLWCSKRRSKGEILTSTKDLNSVKNFNVDNVKKENESSKLTSNDLPSAKPKASGKSNSKSPSDENTKDTPAKKRAPSLDESENFPRNFPSNSDSNLNRTNSLQRRSLDSKSKNDDKNTNECVNQITLVSKNNITYPNHNTGKRKADSTKKVLKKIRSDSGSTDIPMESDLNEYGDTIKIEDNQFRTVPLSIKQMFLDDSDYDDSSNTQKLESMDADTNSAQGASVGVVNFLCDKSSVKSIDLSEEARDSFYSPIFTNSGMDAIKYPRQGKGFGDRSGRGILKDSLRCRQDSPAAVLSDAVTTRPPLALHNFTNVKNSENTVTVKDNILDIPIKYDNDSIRSNFASQNIFKTYKSSLKSDKSFFPSERQIDGPRYKCTTAKENLKYFSELNNNYNILSRIPGLDGYDFLRPPQTTAIVNVVQLGQLSVTTSQQSSLSTTGEPHTASNSFLDITPSNSTEYRPSSNESSHQFNNGSGTELRENDVTDSSNVHSSTSSEGEKSSDESKKTSNDEDNVKENDVHFNNLPTPDEVNSLNDQPTAPAEDVSDNPEQSDIQKPPTDFEEEIKNETKNDPTSESTVENQSNAMPTTSANFVSTSRGLVNLLSQKIMHSSMNNQHLQMATFAKGTTINALSLQQALAQILPQTTSEGVIHSNNHQSGNPQVLHIVQGKNNSQTNTFNSLLVENSQGSVMTSSSGTQVLHIVQGKPNSTSGNSAILNQSQLSGTTFSGLSLIDAAGQQGGNQVLHIVNAGMQTKGGAGGQVLKRVNLLTSITNQQGNNEQKMVQFVCKAPDGKSLQLNAQPPRGMVLRLQPIDGSNYSHSPKVSENQTATVTNSSSASHTPNKSPTEQIQQELKSRSVYEENYAKFIQSSSNQNVPSSPEKSTALPKFNQAFGKSVFQESSPKPNDHNDHAQNSMTSMTNEPPNSQDLSAVNLSQLSGMTNPPLLIRKTSQSSVVHQNIIHQSKQSLCPMNIQTIHGGVIYTRQIPVNISSAQTINLITVPTSDIIDEVQLQNMQKHNQDKNNTNERVDQQAMKLSSRDQQQSNSATGCSSESNSEENNHTFAESIQNNVNPHPLLTQMRIKVPMLSKGGGQMVTGTRVVRPVLQIQRNLIPGANPAVYQQLVLTTAPALRHPIPNSSTSLRPIRPPSAPEQEACLSTSTLEQLREFDMVLEQVKERSTVQPGGNSNSAFSDSNQIAENNTDVDSTQSNIGQVNQSTAQREVLYSIGPNQTVNVTYVNQKIISKSSNILSAHYGSSESSQNSPSSQTNSNLHVAHSHSKPGSSTPTKVGSKAIKSKPSKPANPSSNNASKSSPVAPKTSLQKPLEDEQTTQRILYILAEYKEQVENSPDKDKPAPRRRSNPPTNPTSSGKRKKGSGGSSKKSCSGQSMQEMSPLGGEDAGHTMGSEDSSCGLSQGECTDNSIQGLENQSPQSSPQKCAKKGLFSESDSTTSPHQQQRNVIITDGQTIAMARPGTGKTTTVLMPANYLLPMSMVKGGQQITIVTNQGPKILSVPNSEGGTTNALFVQRLISPAGLKPMLTRPGQVRHLRLPANAMQNLQAFNLNTNIHNQEGWIQTSPNSNQPKLLVEYNPNVGSTSDNPEPEVKTEVCDSPTIKEENPSSVELLTPKIEENSEQSFTDNLDQTDMAGDLQHGASTNPDLPEHLLHHHHHHSHLSKSGSNTLNLIQVHSLNPDCNKLFSVQNATNFIHINKTGQPGSLHALNDNNSSIMISDSQNILIGRPYDGQTFIDSNKIDRSPDSRYETEKMLDSSENMSRESAIQQTYIITQSSPHGENNLLRKVHSSENRMSWSANGNSVAKRSSDSSSSYVSYSPRHASLHQEDHPDSDTRETDSLQELAGEATRVLRHSYSPSSSPTGPRHPFHKMFITAPVRKTFNSHMIDHSASPTDDDKQYIQQHLKKNTINSSSVPSVPPQTKNSSFNVHHHNPQVINICQNDDKVDSDIVGSISGERNEDGQSGASSHSVPNLRHKFAVMEHELRLQKSLSEECEDLGVDSPSASDLFPEAELLFATSPSSQFEQSQDGCTPAGHALVSHASPSTILIPSNVANHQLAGSSLASLQRESRILETHTMEASDELEFARRHPNTTFHSGEIELVGEDATDSSMNIAYRSYVDASSSGIKRNDVVRSVIEGMGNNGGGTAYPLTKNATHFSMIDLQRRSLNIMTLQNTEEYSEGADDSINSGESKEGIVNNKCPENLLPNEMVKRDLNISSADTSICVASGIIQRNTTQVIKHASNSQYSMGVSETMPRPTIEPNPNQNVNSFSLDTTDRVRPADKLTRSSPEQPAETFWESNQPEEPIARPPLPPPPPPDQFDFSSEDGTKCRKSPASVEEANSTDIDVPITRRLRNSTRPTRINSVIKSAKNASTAAEGPILHNALLSGATSAANHDVPKPKSLRSRRANKTTDGNLRRSSSPGEDENRNSEADNWSQKFKPSSHTVVSPQSLATEINIGAEVETVNSEETATVSKPSETTTHSGSPAPEEAPHSHVHAHGSRRVSPRGAGGVKRSCPCCPPGTPATPVPVITAPVPRRTRRKPSSSH